MSTAAAHDLPRVPASTVRAIDPASPAGRAAAAALGELFDDVAARLHREGKPVPDCIAP